MSTPTILNSSFSVVSYNGGPLKGQNGIENMLHASSQEDVFPHSTRNGSNFDLVLEYKNEKHSKFTLTHVVIMAPEYMMVTAPTKDGLVWVTDSTNSSSFSEFNDVNESSYWALEETDALRSNALRPIFFEIRPRAADAVSVVPKGCNSTGNRVHMKFVSSYGEDSNIDMANFFLVGFHGEAPEGYV